MNKTDLKKSRAELEELMGSGTIIDKKAGVNTVFENIKQILDEARANAYRAVNASMVQAYWNVGRVIIEEEQNGKERSGYGKHLLYELSKKLTKSFGQGFTITNLKYMRQFYLAFPKGHALRDQLSWTHYRLLLKVEREDARNFYIIEALENNWSTRELERQVNSLLFERLTLSREKEEVLAIAKQGQKINKPGDLVKDPYVIEFLGLQENQRLLEKELEQALIDHLQEFLLELGKGFFFVARQKRITLDGDHFYIDLVFYNRLARCFVLIDLKVGKMTHQDIGQMQMYVNYYKRTQLLEGENEPIGIILCAEKNDAVVKFTLPESQEQIFVSKYKLYFPTEDELKREILREKDTFEMEHQITEAAAKIK